MKHLRVFLLSFFLLFSTSGCFNNPLRNLQSANTKVEAATHKKEKAEEKISEKAKNYTFGADYALSLDTSPSKESIVAKEMTGLSLAVSGPPPMEEVTDYKGIVDGLLSTNNAKIKKSEAELAAKNKEVEVLQTKLVGLEDKLVKAESDKEKVVNENTDLASKWAKLTKIFWIVVYVAVFGLIAHILNLILPAPYNSIFGIVSAILGLFTKGIIKIAPAAKETAGLISKEVHDTSKEALEHLVAAIEDARTKGNLADKLDPFLRDHTTKDGSREVIKDTKRELGL